MYQLYQYRKVINVMIVILLVLTVVFVIFIRTPIFTKIIYTISDNNRNHGLETPEDIARIDDQRYGEDPMQVFDVYFPLGTTEQLPTIISMHGGNYTYGDKEVYQYYCMNLAQHGFTVVNYSYRLAPEHKYPAPLEDTNAVLTYVLSKAEEYHIDPDNLFFVGDSAGAHLNAQYCTAVTNPEYAAMLDLSIPSFTLRAVAFNCGVYRKADVISGMRFYVGNAKTTETLDFLPYITSDYPPVFLMSSTGDMCLPFIYPMNDSLNKAGVENEVHIYGNESIKPSHVFHLDIKFDVSTVCNNEECAFFSERIRKN